MTVGQTHFFRCSAPFSTCLSNGFAIVTTGLHIQTGMISGTKMLLVVLREVDSTFYANGGQSVSTSIEQITSVTKA